VFSNEGDQSKKFPVHINTDGANFADFEITPTNTGASNSKEL
jgi:hypothetical protein